MANTLKLEIVTPSAVVYSEDVSLVALPGRQGDMGIYPNHVPLMTKVAAGEVEVTRDGQKEMLAVGEGFAEVTGDHVSILTDMAALEADIDEAKAEEALKAAEDRLKGESRSDEQVIAAEAAAAAALAQLKVKRRNRCARLGQVGQANQLSKANEPRSPFFVNWRDEPASPMIKIRRSGTPFTRRCSRLAPA